MGMISDWDLRHPPPAPERGMAVNVGFADATQEATATVVEKKNGVWGYREGGREAEIGIHVWLLKHREIDLGGLEESEVLLWTGMEVKLESTACTRHWKHKDLVAALVGPTAYRRSLNWWSAAKFRPARNQGPAQRLERVRKKLKETRSEQTPEFGPVRTLRGESALPRALAELKFDPFETDKNWLTARMPDPMRFQWNDVRAIGGEYSIAHNPAHRDGVKPKPGKAGPKWSFGLCADLETARSEIRHAVLADQRFSKFSHLLPSGYHGSVEEHFVEILDAAVWQAIAGSVGDTDLVTRAVRLYHDACEAGTKRLKKEPRSSRGKP
ncbi:MAG: hypothetical protein ABJC09_12740 [Terriglobia bacterium]